MVGFLALVGFLYLFFSGVLFGLLGFAIELSFSILISIFNPNSKKTSEGLQPNQIKPKNKLQDLDKDEPSEEKREEQGWKKKAKRWLRSDSVGYFKRDAILLRLYLFSFPVFIAVSSVVGAAVLLIKEVNKGTFFPYTEDSLLRFFEAVTIVVPLYVLLAAVIYLIFYIVFALLGVVAWIDSTMEKWFYRAQDATKMQKGNKANKKILEAINKDFSE